MQEERPNGLRCPISIQPRSAVDAGKRSSIVRLKQHVHESDRKLSRSFQGRIVGIADRRCRSSQEGTCRSGVLAGALVARRRAPGRQKRRVSVVRKAGFMEALK